MSGRWKFDGANEAGASWHTFVSRTYKRSLDDGSVLTLTLLNLTNLTGFRKPGKTAHYQTVLHKSWDHYEHRLLEVEQGSNWQTLVRDTKRRSEGRD